MKKFLIYVWAYPLAAIMTISGVGMLIGGIGVMLFMILWPLWVALAALKFLLS